MKITLKLPGHQEASNESGKITIILITSCWEYICKNRFVLIIKKLKKSRYSKQNLHKFAKKKERKTEENIHHRSSDHNYVFVCLKAPTTSFCLKALLIFFYWFLFQAINPRLTGSEMLCIDLWCRIRTLLWANVLSQKVQWYFRGTPHSRRRCFRRLVECWYDFWPHRRQYQRPSSALNEHSEAGIENVSRGIK